MIIRIITGVALTALLPWGCTVGGGCDSQVDALVERGEQGPYPNALKTELRQLRDAALVFYQRGREAECAAIADGMDELLDDVAQKIETRRELSQRLAYLHSARPVSKIEKILKAEDVVGAEVVNLKDQPLGSIENIALNPDTGQIAYVAISAGGVMGLGEKLVAVPWKDLRVPADREIFVLDRSQAALEQMRGFDEDRWPAQAEKKPRDTQPAASDTQAAPSKP
ncbi:MAG: PRC-barrel domain-containing protein [Gammaproteobacteria bacterium]|nr:PRC-barrel domain-containing protein [Gammaproteobacteria bacterium]